MKQTNPQSFKDFNRAYNRTVETEAYNDFLQKKKISPSKITDVFYNHSDGKVYITLITGDTFVKDRDKRRWSKLDLYASAPNPKSKYYVTDYKTFLRPATQEEVDRIIAQHPGGGYDPNLAEQFMLGGILMPLDGGELWMGLKKEFDRNKTRQFIKRELELASKANPRKSLRLGDNYSMADIADFAKGYYKTRVIRFSTGTAISLMRGGEVVYEFFSKDGVSYRLTYDHRKLENPRKPATVGEKHQLRVLKQLIKMPSAMIPFAGGGYANAYEVAMELKNRFGYTDAQITRLSGDDDWKQMRNPISDKDILTLKRRVRISRNVKYPKSIIGGRADKSTYEYVDNDGNAYQFVFYSTPDGFGARPPKTGTRAELIAASDRQVTAPSWRNPKLREGSRVKINEYGAGLGSGKRGIIVSPRLLDSQDTEYFNRSGGVAVQFDNGDVVLYPQRYVSLARNPISRELREAIDREKESLGEDMEQLDKITQAANPAYDADSDAAWELYLFAENNYSTKGQYDSIVANLERKIAKGDYNSTKAVKAFQNLMNNVSKAYKKEFGSGFSVAVRKDAARMMRDRFEDNFLDGVRMPSANPRPLKGASAYAEALAALKGSDLSGERMRNLMRIIYREGRAAGLSLDQIEDDVARLTKRWYRERARDIRAGKYDRNPRGKDVSTYKGFKIIKLYKPSRGYSHFVYINKSKVEPSLAAKFGDGWYADSIADAKDGINGLLGEGKYARNPSEFNADKLDTLSAMFQGEITGNAIQTVGSAYTPDTTARIGELSFIRVHNGKDTYDVNFGKDAWLSMDARKNLIINGKGAKIKNAVKPSHGNLTLIGDIEQINYITAKRHIENGQTVEYYHELGEVDGVKPQLFLDSDGFPLILNGNYDIGVNGIEN